MASGTPDKIGNYKLLEKIGQGGMGTLYRALDPKIGRHVALKLIREGGDSEEMRERLLREARSAGNLKHGNIVTIFEFGEHEGMPFIAMEYIQGETLTQFLSQRPAPPLHRKLQIIDQMCAGLHYAHRQGVVHRDIKPANIMIDTEGTVKILDFGIARMGATGTTIMGMMIGTLNYMAPEQMEGKSVDARADIFAVGAVIYEIFANRSAFTGSMQSEVMYAILHGRPKPLAETSPGLDPELIAIVDKCLEKKAADRFQDLAALRQAMSGTKARIERTAQTATILAPMPGATPRTPQTGSAPPPVTPAPSARRDSSAVNRLRTRADQMRAEQIQAHLERGRRALESGDHEGAFSACEQVFVLEPQNLQALELEEKTRASVEKVWLGEAQKELERGSLTSAWLLTERVLGMNAESPRVETLRQAIEQARSKQAEAHEKAREVQRQMQRAQQEAAAGRLEDATLLIDKVLQVDPGHMEARTLKGTIAAAAVETKRAEEEARERKAEAERQAEAQRQAQAQAQRQAETQRQAEAQRQQAEALRQQQAEAERLRAEADRRRQQQAAEQHVADMPIRTTPAPPPVAAPVAAAPRPFVPPVSQASTKPSSLPTYLMLGGAGAVAIASIIVGVRLMTNRAPAPDVDPNVAPPPVTQPAVDPAANPPPVNSGPARGSNAVQPPSPNQNPNPSFGQFPPLGPPTVQPPPPDPPPPPPPDPVVRTTPAPPPPPPVNPNLAAREKTLSDQYNRAKAALDNGSFAQAVSLFETLQRDQAGYRDVPDQIARAKAGIASAVKQAMDAAAKLEGSGDLPEAMRQLERVAQIDPSMTIVAEQAMNRVRARMRTEGITAFTNAQQLDALERVDQAITWYERAFRLLPDNDPNKKIAKERLDILRARK